MSKEHYEFEAIWDEVVDKPKQDKMISIQFGPGEGGWAYQLSPDRAVIMNTPLEARLAFMDVVVLEQPPGGGRPSAGEVVWRGFPCKTGILYEPVTQERYKAIFDACLAQRMIVEGMVPGRAIVDHQEGVDVEAVLREAGVDLEGISLQAIPVEPEPEADRVYH